MRNVCSYVVSRSYCDESILKYDFNVTKWIFYPQFPLTSRNRCYIISFINIHQAYINHRLKKKDIKNASTHMLLKKKKKKVSLSSPWWFPFLYTFQNVGPNTNVSDFSGHSMLYTRILSTCSYSPQNYINGNWTQIKVISHRS